MFTFVDLFAGIGGFRIALDKHSGECVAFSEIDKEAVSTYISNYNDDIAANLGDITKVLYIPHVDMLVGGVPCQSWSVAGKMKGFDDPRGQLWNDAIRLVSLSKPKTFVFENVKGLIGAKNKKNFESIVAGFEEQGYFVKTEVLNSYDFDVPQLRERVFIVGFRKDFQKNFNKFKFPKGTVAHKNLAEYLNDVDNIKINKKKFNPVEIFGSVVPASRNAFQKNDELNDFFTFCDTRNGHTSVHSWDLIEATEKQREIMDAILKNRRKKIYGDKDGNPLSLDDICGVLPSVTPKDLEELVALNLLRRVGEKYELKNSKNSSGVDGIYRVYMPYSKIFSTLTATGTRDVVATEYIDTNLSPDEYKQQFIENIVKEKKYRSLTVKEVQKIQGFPDNFIPHKDEKTAKKQFGNAVSPPVVEALALEILATGIFGGHNENYEPREKARDFEQGTIMDAEKHRCAAHQKYQEAV
ncbi:MAG: DNA cytosine methyltransferase [Defluviitaleaceae bacterium]|nr:DNA cytosine methyltransferase [Defluviitaleaceae bacterium]